MPRPAPEVWQTRRVPTAVVALLVAWDDAGRIVRIVLGGEVHAAEAFAARHGARLVRGAGVAEHVERLAAYLAGGPDPADLPVRLLGTDFERRAWQALAKIPRGRVWTYGEQAAAIGRPRAVRAVGAANAKNPVPLVRPCHRVVAAGGRLGGFSAGTDLKRRLLALEGVAPA